MEGHRSRRTRDAARKAWYAYYRQLRFTRWLGAVKVIAPTYQQHRERLRLIQVV